jgi:glycosyltransferase involved in cell wall biosynthesis
VHPGTAGYLHDAMRSVREQVLPAEWELEWLVQEDGSASDLVEQLAGFPGLRYAANGAPLGTAMTRNLALSRAHGELLQNLDADDILLPGGLTAIIAALSDHCDLHWGVGQADDLLPDGSLQAFPPDVPFGRIVAGAANDWAGAHGGNWPLHCAGIMYRTATLRALGGWAAAPTDDDVITFAAVSEATDGWFDRTVTWLYRQHPQQTVRTARHQQWSRTCRLMALQRARAARLTHLGVPGVGIDLDPQVPVAPPRKVTVEIPRQGSGGSEVTIPVRTDRADPTGS